MDHLKVKLARDILLTMTEADRLELFSEFCEVCGEDKIDRTEGVKYPCLCTVG